MWYKNNQPLWALRFKKVKNDKVCSKKRSGTRSGPWLWAVCHTWPDVTLVTRRLREASTWLVWIASLPVRFPKASVSRRRWSSSRTVEATWRLQYKNSRKIWVPSCLAAHPAGDLSLSLGSQCAAAPSLQGATGGSIYLAWTRLILNSWIKATYHVCVDLIKLSL